MTDTTGLGAAWSAVSEGITNIMANPVAALGLTLPIVAMVIGVGKRLFKGRNGG